MQYTHMHTWRSKVSLFVDSAELINIDPSLKCVECNRIFGSSSSKQRHNRSTCPYRHTGSSLTSQGTLVERPRIESQHTEDAIGSHEQNDGNENIEDTLEERPQIESQQVMSQTTQDAIGNPQEEIGRNGNSTSCKECPKLIERLQFLEDQLIEAHGNTRRAERESSIANVLLKGALSKMSYSEHRINELEIKMANMKSEQNHFHAQFEQKSDCKIVLSRLPSYLAELSDSDENDSNRNDAESYVRFYFSNYTFRYSTFLTIFASDGHGIQTIGI